MKVIKKLSHNWLFLALPFLVVVSVIVSVHIVNSMDYHQNDNDFFTFWLAGHLVAGGGNPYDTSQWIAGYHTYEINIIANPTFLYPLPTAMLFVPLGMLPFHTAYITWVTLLQFFLGISIILLLALPANQRARLFFIPMLVGIALFRPTTLALTQGQFIGMMLLMVMLMTVLFEKGKWSLGGIFLGSLILKPNLGMIIIPLMTAWLIIQKRWKPVFTSVLAAIVLLLLGLAYNPNWVGEYLQVGGSKLAHTFGGSPTVWGLSALGCHNNTPCILPFGGGAVSLILLFFFWVIIRKRKSSPLDIVSLVSTVTLLIAPYTWTYDQLLLIVPISLISLAINGKGWRFLLALCLFLIMDLIVLLLLIPDTLLGVEILNAFLPLIVFALLLWIIFPLPRKGTHPG